MVKARHFEAAAGACVLRPAGRRGLIHAYEGRLDGLVTHPLFDYRCSWRTVIKLQARLLARWLRRRRAGLRERRDPLTFADAR